MLPLIKGDEGNQILLRSLLSRFVNNSRHRDAMQKRSHHRDLSTSLYLSARPFVCSMRGENRNHVLAVSMEKTVPPKYDADRLSLLWPSHDFRPNTLRIFCSVKGNDRILVFVKPPTQFWDNSGRSLALAVTTLTRVLVPT